MSRPGRKSLSEGGGESPRTSFVWLPETDESLRIWWHARCPEAKSRSEALRLGVEHLRKLAERGTRQPPADA